MITMKEWMEAIDYRISEGSDFLWECYGPNVYALDANDDHFSTSIIFNNRTQEVYEVDVSDYLKNRAYVFRNPLYKDKYYQEAMDKNVRPTEAWDSVDFIEIEVAEDFLEKMRAIISGKDYDTRIQIQVNLDRDLMFQLMTIAHERDITLNSLIDLILAEELKE